MEKKKEDLLKICSDIIDKKYFTPGPLLNIFQ